MYKDPDTLADLATTIRQWGVELGFRAIGFTDTDLSGPEADLLSWLDADHHGTMEWMARHGTRRTRPESLVPGTRSVITARMDYWPEPSADPWAILGDGRYAYISRYALGRDYHKLLRRRLQQLATRIEAAIGPFGYRVFTDSAPVMEKPLAGKGGLGWQGKHTNLINRSEGSWFFLGEIYTDLELPADTPAEDHCGTCDACIEICPTGAITAPYRLDARLCISYLTIEHAGPIPRALRPAIGNRIYGCDDCQLVCPWNRFATPTPEADFMPRQGLDEARLVDLFLWDEEEFLQRTQGSPIRRIGHERWLRNIAVALGNAPASGEVRAALGRRSDHASALVREHVAWALSRVSTPDAGDRG